MTYRVYVDNLTDTAPYLDFRRPAGFSAADTLRPRTIGLGARARY
jgi:iron complex outermembrane recepter protein